MGLAATLYGLWQCRGAKEALGIVRLLYSDTLRVRLCRLGLASPRWTFKSLLGGKGGQLQGLTCGPRSRLAPRGRRKLVFLCYALFVTLSWEWPARPCLKRSVWEPLSLGSSGLVILRLGLGWRCRLLTVTNTHFNHQHSIQKHGKVR